MRKMCFLYPQNWEFNTSTNHQCNWDIYSQRSLTIRNRPTRWYVIMHEKVLIIYMTFTYSVVTRVTWYAFCKRYFLVPHILFSVFTISVVPYPRLHRNLLTWIHTEKTLLKYEISITEYLRRWNREMKRKQRVYKSEKFCMKLISLNTILNLVTMEVSTSIYTHRAQKRERAQVRFITVSHVL